MAAACCLILTGLPAAAQTAAPETPQAPLQRAQQDLERLRLDLQAAQNQFTEIRDILAKTHAELVLTRKELLRTKEVSARSQAEFLLASKLLAETTAVRDELLKKLNEVNRDLKKSREAAAADREEAMECRRQLASAQKALLEIAAERTVLQKELRGARLQQQAAEAKTEALGKELASARVGLISAEKTLAEAVIIREALLKTVTAEKNKNVAAEKRLEEAASQLTEMQAKLTAAEATMVSTQRNAEASRRRLSDVSQSRALDGKGRFIIEVPSPDAKLYVDGCVLDPGERKVMREFVTAKLQPGKRYTLNLKVELVKDGRPVTVERQVTFEGNTEHRLYLGPPLPASRSEESGN